MNASPVSPYGARAAVNESSAPMRWIGRARSTTPLSTASSPGCRSETRRLRACSPAAGRASSPRSRTWSSTHHRRDFDDGGDEDYCEDTFRWCDAAESVITHRAAPIASFEVHGKLMCRFVVWFDEVLHCLCLYLALPLRGRCRPSEPRRHQVFSNCYELPSSVYPCNMLISLERVGHNHRRGCV